MPHKAYWTFVVLIVLCGACLRLVGLGHREPSVDEMHYRGNMSNTAVFLRQHSFRNHSVKHPLWQVPHGLLAPAISFVVGHAANRVWPFPYQDLAERDNFYSRLGYALGGIVLMLLLFLLGRSLFGPAHGLLALWLSACSPILVNWSRSEYLDTPMSLFLIASFYCMWSAGRYPHRRHLLSAATGAFAGLALSTKWPALMVLPYVPTAYITRQWQTRRSMSWIREDSVFMLLFLAGLTLTAFTFLSLDSFRWAIFPPAGALYGDLNVPIGMRLMLGIQETWRWESISAIGIYRMGLGFLPLISYSLLKSIPKNDPAISLILFIVFSGITLMQEGSWEAWRATYPVCGAVLLTAWGLLHMKFRTIAVVGFFVLMLPATILMGMRLVPAPVPYFGAQYLYSAPLPPLAADHQIFH